MSCLHRLQTAHRAPTATCDCLAFAAQAAGCTVSQLPIWLSRSLTPPLPLTHSPWGPTAAQWARRVSAAAAATQAACSSTTAGAGAAGAAEVKFAG
jgi:hypothetical protein